MRVLLDATYAARSPYSGTGVYIEQLTQALARLEVEVETAVNRRRRPPAGGGLRSVRNLAADWLWTTAELPRLARRARADLIHHPLPARAPGAAFPQVITVHDLAFERLPELFDRGFRTYAHRSHRAAARSAAAVICVSETTAADVKDLWGVDPERVVVAPHGAGQGIARARRGDAHQEHFLYVGDAEPRKNLSTLITAYARYRQLATSPAPLIVAGSAHVEGTGISYVPGPDRDRLSALHAGALALIQPSLYEGFGLTALEAMSAGTPVIASEVPGLREVCGESASYFDPRDPEALAAAMAQLAAEARLRSELAQRGLRRAAELSWDDCARAHVDAYSLALSSR